ncbi:MAG: hypothetical protein ACI4O7_01760 [Aristaeellaceae bacterium]
MKLTKHAWVLWGVALAVVLVLAFVIPFSRTAVYWMALGCTAAMFGVCAFAFARAFRKDDQLESKLLGWPVFKVGYAALIVQIVVGFALMALSALCPVWVSALVEVIVFAASAVCLTVKDAAREAVAASEAKVADNTAAWKAIRVRANQVAAETGHPDIRRLAEDIRYADPTPTAMDEEIAQMLETLSSYADAANIAKAKALMEQRKALAKSSK